MIRGNDEHYRLYAVLRTERVPGLRKSPNDFRTPSIRDQRIPPRTVVQTVTQLTVLVLRELRGNQQVEHVTSLVDDITISRLYRLKQGSDFGYATMEIGMSLNVSFER